MYSLCFSPSLCFISVMSRAYERFILVSARSLSHWLRRLISSLRPSDRLLSLSSSLPLSLSVFCSARILAFSLLFSLSLSSISSFSLRILAASSS